MASIPKTLVIDFADSLIALQTKAVDAIPAAAFNALEYLVSIRSTLPVRSKFLKVTVHKTDTDLSTQVHGRDGEGINLEIDAILNGDDAELTIKNNESFGIEIAATRIII